MEQVSPFRDLLVCLSAFSIGSALFTASLALRMIRANPRRYLSFAAAKVGYALVAGIVLLKILPVPVVPVNAWSAGYIVGLTLAGIGFIGVGRSIRREFVAWEMRRDVAATAADIEHLVEVTRPEDEEHPEGVD